MILLTTSNTLDSNDETDKPMAPEEKLREFLIRRFTELLTADDQDEDAD